MALIMLKCLIVIMVILHLLMHILNVLGYISFIIIKNPYFKGKEMALLYKRILILNGLNNVMNGLKRLKVLGNIYIWLININGIKNIGKIAFIFMKVG